MPEPVRFIVSPVSDFMPNCSASVVDVAMKFMSMKTWGGSTSSCWHRDFTLAMCGAVPVKITALLLGM